MAETSVMEDVMRVPEARYAYYRRCQVFRKGGAQCKAPAEQGSLICYAHAGQLATAVRRERDRRSVLEEAVAQMRKRGNPQCEMADLFMDFRAINVTLAVMAQALIDGRIDCKTAGRLVVQLQTASKLLWMLHRKGTSTREARRHGEEPSLTAEARRRTPHQARTGLVGGPGGERQKNLPLINTDTDPLKREKNREQNGIGPRIIWLRMISTPII
jgi:hypothetical protein